MPTIPISLGNGHAQEYSLTVSSQQCINMRPYYPQTEAISGAVLYPTAGLIEELDLGSDKNGRGQEDFLEDLYTVSGNTLYRIDKLFNGDHNAVELGEIGGEGHVWMAKNTTQLCILVPNVIAYIYTVEDGLKEITDENFLGPGNGVVYLNGFFYFTTNDAIIEIGGSPTSIVFQSELEDGLTYRADAFATAQLDPDKIVAPFVFRNQLYVFGTEITEVFDPIESANFNLQTNRGYVIDKGLAAPFAIVENEDSIVFLGGSRTELPAIWRLESNVPVHISTNSEDVVIQRYSPAKLAQAFAMAYSMDGGCFAVFSFPDDTMSFDIYASRAAGRPIWHRQQSFAHQRDDRWHVHDITKVYGSHYALDHFTGIVGRLSMDYYTEAGKNIKRTYSSPTLYNGSRSLIVQQLEIIVESGTSPDEVESLLTMTVSLDGGKTWGDRRPASAGARGQNQVRLIWYGLGWVEQFFNFRLQWWADAKLVIAAAELTYRGKIQMQGKE